MSDKYFVVNKKPESYNEDNCHAVISREHWVRTSYSIGSMRIVGRKGWHAPEPSWPKEMVYYNTTSRSLPAILSNIVVHHTDNSESVATNELKQKHRGYAALGYHFFINEKGLVFEGRPIEVMGSHAGRGKVAGPLSDPDWGAVGIVLQGDFHHDDDIIFSDKATKLQLYKLEKLIIELSKKYRISQLLMHREVDRIGSPTLCPGDHLANIITKLRGRLEMIGAN